MCSTPAPRGAHVRLEVWFPPGRRTEPNFDKAVRLSAGGAPSAGSAAAPSSGGGGPAYAAAAGAAMRVATPSVTCAALEFRWDAPRNHARSTRRTKRARVSKAPFGRPLRERHAFRHALERGRRARDDVARPPRREHLAHDRAEDLRALRLGARRVARRRRVRLGRRGLGGRARLVARLSSRSHAAAGAAPRAIRGGVLELRGPRLFGASCAALKPVSARDLPCSRQAAEGTKPRLEKGRAGCHGGSFGLSADS